MSKKVTKKEIVKLAYILCDAIDEIIVNEGDDNETILEFLKDRDDVKNAVKEIKKYFNNDYTKMDEFFENTPNWTYFADGVSTYIKDFFNH